MPVRELVGRIIRIQIQRIPIKIKGRGYESEGIVEVPIASVDAWGIVGWYGDVWAVDAHHRAHPARRGGGRRPLSIGFTGHYTLMAERFGNAPIGIAGENIIVDGPALTLDDLGVGLVVVTSHGAEVLLERPRVATPCLEFTSFMLGLGSVAPREEIEEPLADLDHGRRGFIVSADSATAAVEIALGDMVYLAG